MSVAAVTVGLAIAAIGMVAAAKPDRMVAWLTSLDSTTRYRVAVVVRVIIGMILVTVAPVCRWPTFVRVVGYVTLAAAAVLLVIREQRTDRLVQWWVAQPDTFKRSWALSACVFGLVLAYAGGLSWP